MNINYTLFGQMVFFVLFVVFCVKIVWPPIIKAMQERAEKIADGLAAADRAAKDLELAQEKAGSELKEAKAQAAQIIDAAKKRGEQMVEEAKQKALDEAERIRLSAEAEVEQQVAKAREELRGSVAKLSIAGAEKILGETVDAAKHSDMLNKLAAQL